MPNAAGKNDDEPEGIGHTEIPEESAESESELSMSAQVEKRETEEQ
ncbi:hypothetical protein GCM10023201_04030 [Actinomycetospora corticicola]|uniref:Uncharacterized protein n=1 Tax=Actinomycetospora corticicola TaxID=663602 RepID=A0A7Y9DTM2_9PSEU|nr:hypothetical protein [Actinomycetospora corticicola]NYD34952.1 hypothetical protein [Actinomycetospora corticicola]